LERNKHLSDVIYKACEKLTALIPSHAILL